MYTTLACSKKARTKASRIVQFQSELTQLACLSIPGLLPARPCLGGTCPYREETPVSS